MSKSLSGLSSAPTAPSLIPTPTEPPPQPQPMAESHTTSEHAQDDSRLLYMVYGPGKVDIETSELKGRAVKAVIYNPPEPVAKIALETFTAQGHRSRSLSEFQERLKTAYKKKDSFIKRVFSSPFVKKDLPIGQCFISLAIVEGSQQRQKEQDRLKTLQQVEVSEIDAYYEELFSTKEKILFSSEDLLNLKNGNKPLRLLVLGRPGSGKSTLCQRQAYNWWSSGGPWQKQFDLVITIKLRKLRDHRYETIEDMIYQEYFAHASPDERVSKEEIRKFLGEVPKNRQLYIIDGLDEFPITSPSKETIHRLLDENERHNIFVTSRLHARPENTSFHSTLECIGFSEEKDVEEYIDKVSTLTSEATKLKKFLKDFAPAGILAHTPLLLHMLIATFPKMKLSDSFTITNLYQAMLDQLWFAFDNTLVESGVEQPEEEKMLAKRFLSELAFSGAVRNHILFDRSTVEQKVMQICLCGRDSVLRHIRPLLDPGLLHCHQGETADEQQFYFPHLTIQEYYVAAYLEGKYRDQQTKRTVICYDESGQTLNEIPLREFVARHKLHPRFLVVWQFLAGMLARDEGTGIGPLQLFFDDLTSAPRNLVFDFEIWLRLRCLEEAGVPFQLSQTQNYVAQLEDYSKFIKPDWLLQFLVRNRQVCAKSRVVEFLTQRLEKETTDLNYRYDILICLLNLSSAGHILSFSTREVLKRIVCSNVDGLLKSRAFQVLATMSEKYPIESEVFSQISGPLKTTLRGYRDDAIDTIILEALETLLEKKQLLPKEYVESRIQRGLGSADLNTRLTRLLGSLMSMGQELSPQARLEVEERKKHDSIDAWISTQKQIEKDRKKEKEVKRARAEEDVLNRLLIGIGHIFEEQFGFKVQVIGSAQFFNSVKKFEKSVRHRGLSLLLKVLAKQLKDQPASFQTEVDEQTLQSVSVEGLERCSEQIIIRLHKVSESMFTVLLPPTMIDLLWSEYWISHPETVETAFKGFLVDQLESIEGRDLPEGFLRMCIQILFNKASDLKARKSAFYALYVICKSNEELFLPELFDYLEEILDLCHEELVEEYDLFDLLQRLVRFMMEKYIKPSSQFLQKFEEIFFNTTVKPKVRAGLLPTLHTGLALFITKEGSLIFSINGVLEMLHFLDVEDISTRAGSELMEIIKIIVYYFMEFKKINDEDLNKIIDELKDRLQYASVEVKILELITSICKVRHSQKGVDILWQAAIQEVKSSIIQMTWGRACDQLVQLDLSPYLSQLQMPEYFRPLFRNYIKERGLSSTRLSAILTWGQLSPFEVYEIVISMAMQRRFPILFLHEKKLYFFENNSIRSLVLPNEQLLTLFGQLICEPSSEGVLQGFFSGVEDTFRALETTSTPTEKLVMAAFNDSIDEVQALIPTTDINRSTHEKWTALLVACDKGALRIAQIFMDNGADVNRAGYARRTPLMQAARNGHLDIVQLLVKKGANIHLKDAWGWTALMIAARRGKANVVQFLFSEGANFHEVGNAGETAISEASSQGFNNIVDLLL